MKNNFFNIVLTFCLFFNITTHLFSEEFKFNISEIEIMDNGNIYNGINGGTITTQDNLMIISDNFKYNKKENKVDTFGNAKIIDTNNNVTITANKISYLKNKEEVFTQGETKININNKYFIKGKNLILFRNDMILSSMYKTTIQDTFDNIYIILYICKRGN